MRSAPPPLSFVLAVCSTVVLLGGGCRDPAEPEATGVSHQALRWAANFDNNPLHDAVVRINAPTWVNGVAQRHRRE